MTQPNLDGAAIIDVLNRNGVEYIVIGAFAAQLHNAPIPATFDIDFTPARTPDNFTRLDKALTELKAKIRIKDAPYGLSFGHSPSSIAQIDVLNLTCEFGDFDLSWVPSGTTGYDDLARSAHTIPIGDISARVADLADVIRSKRAAGRPKDLAVLAILTMHAQTLGIDIADAIDPSVPEVPQEEVPDGIKPTGYRRRR